MGDTFEVVVDVEATLDEAPRLASTIIEWLTVEGSIDATPTDDRDVWGAGYCRPGPNREPGKPMLSVVDEEELVQRKNRRTPRTN